MFCQNKHYYSGDYCHICSEPPPKKKQKPIKKVSDKNLVRLSDGSKINRTELKSRIDKAKGQLQELAKRQNKEYCWACGNKYTFLSWSHVISVATCISDGRSDFAYYLLNMTLECTEKCHIETEIRNIEHHKNCDIKKEIIEVYKNIVKKS